MQWKGLYKERNPSRKWDGQFTNEKRERNKDLTVKISVLTVNEHPSSDLPEEEFTMNLCFFCSC